LPDIDPIIPKLSKHVPVGDEWRYELKLDGFRGLLHIENGQGWFTSKRKNRMTRFQSFADAITKRLKVRDAIFDGELVALTKKLPDFYALLFRRGGPEYAAFDLLWLNGRDLRQLTYIERKRILKTTVRKQDVIGYVEHHTDSRLFEVAAYLDLEGIVAKKRTDSYGSETPWLKVKHAAYSQQLGRWELFERGKSNR